MWLICEGIQEESYTGTEYKSPKTEKYEVFLRKMGSISSCMIYVQSMKRRRGGD